MAERKNKVDGNVSGKIYVDTNCIACELCAADVPECFKMNGGGDYALVYRQPADDAELKKCLEAIENCPADAIGDDGE
jgi:ferredoxin